MKPLELAKTREDLIKLRNELKKDCNLSKSEAGDFDGVILKLKRLIERKE